jgi:hypothetical protein
MYDLAEPDCTESFIDTVAGDAWATDAADRLMECKPLVIGNIERLGAFALADKLAELTCQAADDDGNFSAMILYAALGEGDKARAAFEAFMGRKFVESLAYEMVAEFAEEYAGTLGDD